MRDRKAYHQHIQYLTHNKRRYDYSAIFRRQNDLQASL